MSGIFQDTNGPGSVVAARMAAEDLAAEGGRGRIEIISGDHRNRPDVGSAIARRWIDQEGVDAILDLPNSAVGLAVNTVLSGTRGANLASTAATPDLTGPQGSPNTVTWVSDLRAGPHRRARDDGTARRHVVLPHGGLCARPHAAARCRGLRGGPWRARAGRGEASAGDAANFSSFLLQSGMR